MGKGDSQFAAVGLAGQEAAGEYRRAAADAFFPFVGGGTGAGVLGIQTKLHQWATGDPSRRFDDLLSLRRANGVMGVVSLRHDR